MGKHWYTYKDFQTGKTRRTSGKFDGWTPPTGLLNIPYAIFRTAKTNILVPAYLLTPETKTAIAQAKG